MSDGYQQVVALYVFVYLSIDGNPNDCRDIAWTREWDVVFLRLVSIEYTQASM